MKTNQIMTRKMSQFDVLQRTSDGMFNASALLRQWNENNPDKVKGFNDFWESKETYEFIDELSNRIVGAEISAVIEC